MAKNKTNSTWKTRVLASMMDPDEPTGVGPLTRKMLDGLEVAGVFIDVYTRKMDRVNKDLRKAREVLQAALAAAHVEASEQFAGDDSGDGAVTAVADFYEKRNPETGRLEVWSGDMLVGFKDEGGTDGTPEVTK